MNNVYTYITFKFRKFIYRICYIVLCQQEVYIAPFNCKIHNNAMTSQTIKDFGAAI